MFADGKYALTANQTADSVSFIDLEQGKVVSETPVGKKPSGVAVSQDGKRAAVTNLWSGDVTLFTIGDNKLTREAQVSVGAFPAWRHVCSKCNHIYIAVAGADEVVELAWSSHKIMRRFTTAREPRQVVVSADGKHLVAASSLGLQVRLWDLASGKEQWRRPVSDGFNVRGLTFTPDGQHLLIAHAVRRELPFTKHNIEEGWAIDTRMSRFAVKESVQPPSWQVALDLRAQAVADPHGLAFTPKGDVLAMTAGGSQELILFEKDGITWNGGEPGDFMDFATEKRTRYTRPWAAGPSAWRLNT